MKKILILLLITVSISACCTCKITPDRYKGTQIVFGKGGGFTGRYEYFTLLRNGNVFTKKEAESPWQLARVAGSEQAASIVKLAQKSGITGMQLDDPGNMTYFITIKSGKRTTDLKWGGNNQQPPKEILDLYSQLFNLVKN